MKIAGGILTVLGGLMFISSLLQLSTMKDSEHDISQHMGAVGFSGLLLALGVALWMKGSKKGPTPPGGVQ